MTDEHANRSEGLGAAPQAASRGPVNSPEARGAPGPGAPTLREYAYARSPFYGRFHKGFSKRPF
jgi:hypothetical protein